MNRPIATTPTTTTTTANGGEPITPRRLELSLNPEDGSLLTAPLLSVLLAATDGLYTDLYNMAHGELEVTSALPVDADQDQQDDDPPNQQQQQQQQQAATPGGAPAIQKKERMSNLSFAQRRHELAYRLAQHGKTLTHVSALTASAASSDIATATRVSTKALQHARTAWVQADEAQDALYFFHAQLFPARQAPHDVLGALDTLLLRSWADLPADLKLLVDRYDTSRERQWSSQEVADRWHMAVRDKLLRGEVGWMRQNNIQNPWTVSLRGGIVRLKHGTPKLVNNLEKDDTEATADGGHQRSSTSSSTKTTLMYPIEAVLTVLSTAQPAEWTLVSVEVHAEAKTGESNHQLDTTNRQRYDLHRLCALAMLKEEARHRRETAAKTAAEEGINIKADDASITPVNSVSKGLSQTSTPIQETASTSAATTTTITLPSSASVPRPLHALFQVAQTFGLSWQLEILSAQAQALRKGVWAASDAHPIVVTPVQFFEDHSLLGVVSISFWNVDDRYGPPRIGDLFLDGPESMTTGDTSDSAMKVDSSKDQQSTSTNEESLILSKLPSAANQLTLSVRAEASVGIRVSLSGAESIMNYTHVQPHVRSTIEDLLQATSNPFALSASEALLAATRLCAERKCHAVVNALQPINDANSMAKGTTPILPPWIALSVERGSIAVAARISYHGIHLPQGVNMETTNGKGASKPVVLFRLACDARTGSFASTFSRSSRLLQLMACNDLKATEFTALRIAIANKRNQAQSNRRRGALATATGRVVRDAFEGLSRSMNVLGQRTGFGGPWNDKDPMSASLRQRAVSVASKDVRTSLITCCGMAALYGFSAVAIGVCTGVAASPDMAGGNLDSLDGINFLPTPPVSLMMEHRLVETSSVTTDGEKKKHAYTEQQLFGISCSVDDQRLTLYPTRINVQLESPTAAPSRINCSLTMFKEDPNDSVINDTQESVPPSKRAKIESNGNSSCQELMVEVEKFASILSHTIALEEDQFLPGTQKKLLPL